MTTLSLPPIVAAGVITDSLGRDWDPLKHPRGRDGKFIHTFKRIRAFLSAMDSDPWMTGEVTKINPDGSIRVRIKKTTDPNLVDPSSGQSYVDHEVDITPDLAESINEKAILGQDGKSAPKPSVFSSMNYGDEMTTWKSFRNRFFPDLGSVSLGSVDLDSAVASLRNALNSGQDIDEWDAEFKEKKGHDFIRDQAKYMVATRVLTRAETLNGDDGKDIQHSNDKFRAVLEQLGVDPNIIDDTPDGMSGFDELAGRVRAWKSPTTGLDRAPRTPGASREVEFGDDGNRVAFFGKDFGGPESPMTLKLVDKDGNVDPRSFNSFNEAREAALEPKATITPSMPDPAQPVPPPEPEEIDPDFEEEPSPDDLADIEGEVDAQYTDVDTSEIMELAQDIHLSESEYGETYASSIAGIAGGVEEGSYSVEEARAELRSLAGEIQDEADDFDNPQLERFAKNLRAAADNLGVSKKAELDVPEEEQVEDEDNLWPTWDEIDAEEQEIAADDPDFGFPDPDDEPVDATDPPEDPVDSLEQVLEGETGQKFEVLDDPGQNGDGYYPSTDGSHFWGKYGAAGVLVRNVDENGVERYLMVQRGPIVSTNKGKWQLPGGALNSNENDYQGTARELNEELQSPDGWLDTLTPAGEVKFDHPSGWHYTNIAADSNEMFEPTVDGTETSDAKWFTKEEIAQLPLHPALEKSLPDIFGQFQKKQYGSMFEPGDDKINADPDNIAPLDGPDEEPNDGQIVPFEDEPDPELLDAQNNHGQGPALGQVIDATNWENIGGQQGSNKGGTFADEKDEHWYVKRGKSDEHAKNEALAAAFYQEAGIPTANLQLADTPFGGLGTASPLIPGAKSDLKTQLNDPQYKDDLAQGFAMDAWLANWDVAGLVYDNIVTDENGVGVRIDPGGALLYRAQGAPKGGAFGNAVGELQTLKDKQNTGSRLFNEMTLQDEVQSAQKVLAISPERIDELVDAFDFDPATADKLKSTLKARRDFIAQYYSLDLPENATELDESVSSTGIDMNADYKIEIDLENADDEFLVGGWKNELGPYIELIDEDAQPSEEGQPGYHSILIEGEGWALKQFYDKAFPSDSDEDFEGKLSPSFQDAPEDDDDDPWANVPSASPTALDWAKAEPTPAPLEEEPLAEWEKELLQGDLYVPPAPATDEQPDAGPDSEDWEAMVDAAGPYRWDASGNKIRVGDKVTGADGVEMTISKFENNNKGVIAIDANGKKRIRHRKKISLAQPATQPDESEIEDEPAAEPDSDPIPVDDPDAPDGMATVHWDNQAQMESMLADAKAVAIPGSWHPNDYVNLGDGYQLKWDPDENNFEVHDSNTGEIGVIGPVTDTPDEIAVDIKAAIESHMNGDGLSPQGGASSPTDPDNPYPGPTGKQNVFSTWENDLETFAYDFQGFVNDAEDGNAAPNDYFSAGDDYTVTYHKPTDEFALWKLSNAYEDHVVGVFPNNDAAAENIQQAIKDIELVGTSESQNTPDAPAAPMYDSNAELAKINDIPKTLGGVLKAFPGGQMDAKQVKQYRNAGYALDDASKAEVDSPEWNLAVNKAIFNLTASGPAGKAKLAEVNKWRTDTLNAKHGGVIGDDNGDAADIVLPDGFAPVPTNTKAVYEYVGEQQPNTVVFAVIDNQGGVVYHTSDGKTSPMNHVTEEALKNHSAWAPFGGESVSTPDTPNTTPAPEPVSTPEAPTPSLSQPHKLDLNGNPMFIGDKVFWTTKAKEVTVVGFENNDVGVIVKSIGPDGKPKKHALNRKKLKVQSHSTPPTQVANKATPPVVSPPSFKAPKVEPDPNSPWFGTPAPKAPELPSQDLAPKKLVSDAWLADADKNYKLRMKSKNPDWPEKDLSASSTYVEYIAVQKGDKSALEKLKKAGRITQPMYDNALAQINAGNKEYDAAYAEYSEKLKKYREDTKAWRKANGLAAISLRGMDQGTLKFGNKDAKDWMYENQVPGALNTSGKLSTTAKNAVSSQKGSNISGPLRSAKEKTLDPEWIATHGNKDILGMDQAMLESPPLKHDFNVVRTFAVNSFTNPDTGERYKGTDNLSNMVGSIQHDWGFAETSVGSFEAGATTTWGSQRPVEMELRLPAGLRVVYTLGPDMGLGLSSERGLILERGIAYYIHRVEKVNGKWRLYAEVIPKDVDYDQFGHFINENPFFD